MQYMTTKEAAEKWGIKERRVRAICKEGLVPEVRRVGNSWQIPADLEKPVSAKKQKKTEVRERLELIYNTSFFDEHRGSSKSPEEEALCVINQIYLEGNLEQAVKQLNALEKTCTDEGYLFVIYYLQYCAHVNMGNRPEADAAVKRLSELLLREDAPFYARALISFLLIPDYDFDIAGEVPHQFIPVFVYHLFLKSSYFGLGGLADFNTNKMELLCKMLEQYDHPAMELYVHAILSMYYSLMVNTKLYEYHVDKALAIALSHRWYTPLAEFSYCVSWEKAAELNPDAHKKIKALSESIIHNYISIGIFNALFPQYGEIDLIDVRTAFLAASGKSNTEISDILNVSQYKVKSCLETVYSFTGTEDKRTLKKLIMSTPLVIS